MTGYQRTLPRTKLLRQLRKHRARSAFRGEVERRDRLVAELRKARVTGIRVTLPVETLDAKLASLPEGVSVSRNRIEVRFNGAKEAVGRLYSLAIGRNALRLNAGGSSNTAIGYEAGINNRTGGNNVYIGSRGENSDEGVIRIGDPNTHTKTYLTGEVVGDIKVVPGTSR